MVIWFTYYKFFDRVKEADIHGTKWRRLSSQILNFLHFSSFVSKENLVFSEGGNPSQRVVVVEEELYWCRWHCKLRGFTWACVYRWGMWASESSRLMVEGLLETKRRSHAFYKPMDVHSVTNVGKSVSSISMSNTRLFYKNRKTLRRC